MHEQIVSVKVKWEDQSEDACEEEAGCCGVGQCENRFNFDPKEHLALQKSKCCVLEDSSIEVLQTSPDREILTEEIM